MLTKQFRASTIVGALGFLVFAGACCSPPASQSLLDGKRLLEKGQAGAAAVRLEVATQKMPSNAVAWSYLAVAWHYSGSLSNAESAYHEALRLSPELVDSRFGLGMLYWEQSRWGAAREQLAAVTVLRPDHALAWLRLGECQVWLDDVRGALVSLSHAATLDARSPEAWNWLGVAQVQSRQWRDAEVSFEKALSLQMNHGPALLNLAILREQHLNQPREALDLYRQYLAFWPGAVNSDHVRITATALERQLVPPPAPAKPTGAALTVAQAPAVSMPTSTTPAKTPPPPLTDALLGSTTEPTPPPNAGEPQGQSRPPADPVPAPPPAQAPDVSPSSTHEESAPATQPKRGFFARLNPINLFRGEPEPETQPPKPTAAAVSNQEASIRRSTSETSLIGVASASTFRRYAHRLDAPVSRGRQEEARRLAQDAARLRLMGRLSESAAACREAIALEPASYEAHFNLGLVMLQTADVAAAVSAFEDALLLDPGSDAARYNFGLALKQAGYPVDAALQMQQLLERDPADVRAHLMLGNLYDRPFGNERRARSHYLRVLEMAPQHPEAGAIRFWLKENPL